MHRNGHLWISAGQDVFVVDFCTNATTPELNCGVAHHALTSCTVIVYVLAENILKQIA